MIKYKIENTLSKSIIHLIFIVFSLLCIIPIVAVISISLSTEMDIGKYGYSLIPRTIDLLAYKYVFANPQQIVNAYIISIILTVFGTIVSLLLSSMLAYSISRSDYKHKNKITFFLFFTMLFNGGLVPWYMLVTNILHLKDTIWSLMLPYLILPWFVFLLRTYFQKLPISLVESAKLDGARELRIFWTIVLPLSKPALATVGLFIMLMFWNDWWLGLLFVQQNKAIISIQLMLYNMMADIEFLSSSMNSAPAVNVTLPSESARMAMCILAAGPMLFVFPFFQKYFVKGLTVGAVKG